MNHDDLISCLEKHSVKALSAGIGTNPEIGIK